MNASDGTNKKNILLSGDIAAKNSNNNSNIEKEKARFSFR